MTAPQTSANLSLLAAEAFGALERAGRHSTALSSALDQAHNALNVAGFTAHRDQLAKLIEFHRLVAVRLDVLAKRVGEGAP